MVVVSNMWVSLGRFSGYSDVDVEFVVISVLYDQFVPTNQIGIKSLYSCFLSLMCGGEDLE